MPISDLKWKAPGRGPWERNSTNFPRPLTDFYSEILPEQFAAGFREGSRRYGLLLDYLDYRFVNGFAYFAARPVGVPSGVTGVPPKWLFKLLAQVHPELRRRLRVCASLFEDKPWRDDLKLWDQEVKPASIAINLALQAVDPTVLSTDALLAHMDQCREHFKRTIYQHARFTLPTLLPTGDFLAHAMEWTGLASTSLLQLLRGSTPTAARASGEATRLVNALRESPAARARLTAEEFPAEAFASVSELSGELAAAVSEYLETVGYRIVGSYDPGDPYGLEMPAMLVRALASSVDGEPAMGELPIPTGVATNLRAAVPISKHSLFDELLGEARTTQRLRDERGLLGDIWAAGIMRRVILTAGKRLAETGRIHEPSHLVETRYDDMRSLVSSGKGSAASELAAKARYRDTSHSLDVPSRLGRRPDGRPPFDWLPPAAARATRALYAVVDATFGASEQWIAHRTVRGIPVSHGLHEGIARIVLGPEDFVRLRQGDVLVTHSTSPAFNVVLPLLGAVVTDRGGVLSHAAIVAREYGIPCVVGTGNATAWIADGTRVLVDGSSGEVVVLQ